jgi:hypothetical protein
MALRWTAAGMLDAERQFGRSSVTATSPRSSSPSNATTIVTVKTPQCTATKRPLSSQRSNDHTGTAVTKKSSMRRPSAATEMVAARASDAPTPEAIDAVPLRLARR